MVPRDRLKVPGGPRALKSVAPGPTEPFMLLALLLLPVLASARPGDGCEDGLVGSFSDLQHALL